MVIHLPRLALVTPQDGRRTTVLRARPSLGAADMGEAPSGLHLVPLATTPNERWWAVSWAGQTAWLPAADLTPLQTRGVTDERPEFQWPVGPVAQRGGPALPRDWYVAVGFNQVYQAALRRQAIHPGLDLNLRTGGDSDLGQAVYAAADGEVTASGAWPVWGNIVLIRHAMPGGDHLWSQYAHLERRSVRVGDVVRVGQQVGTVGKGDRRRFAAHLHFEIRRHLLLASYWPGMDRETVLRNYLDPATVIGPSVVSAASPAPVLVGAVDPDSGTLAALQAAGGGWVGHTVPMTEDGDVPAVGVPDDGLNHVLHLTASLSEGLLSSGPAFARLATKAVERLSGEPWAILLGGDWDLVSPNGRAPDPGRAAAAFNLAAERVREALAGRGQGGLRIGPGPLARRSDAADPVAFWVAMLDDISDLDLLAVRAQTFGAGIVRVPDASTEVDGQPVGNGLHRYRRLLAAVPEPWRCRPALLYGVDPNEPRPEPSAGWLAALVANAQHWNSLGRGPRIRGVLAARGKPGDARLVGQEPAALREPALTSGNGLGQLPVPGDWPLRWQGKGLLVTSPWPLAGADPGAIVRSWRQSGLGFVALRLSQGPPTREPEAGALALALGLRQVEYPVLWGWSILPARSLAMAVAGVADQARRYEVGGWLFQLTAGLDLSMAARCLERLRADAPDLPLGLTWVEEADATAIDSLAPLFDVLLPQVSATGAIGRTLAAVTRFGRAVVPVLRVHRDGSPILAFIHHAQDLDLPGAALAVATAMPEHDTLAAFRALADSRWPAPAPTPVGDDPLEIAPPPQGDTVHA